MENNTEIAVRINELIANDTVTPSAFAIQVGIDPANLRRKLSGEQNITIKDIDKICKAKGINPDWLQYGRGEKYIIVSEDEVQINIKEEIISLTKRLTMNENIILEKKRENEDIMKSLNTLCLMLK